MGTILEFVPRCSRHSKSMGEGPQCFSKCREEVEAAQAQASKPEHVVEPTVKVSRKAKSVLVPADQQAPAQQASGRFVPGEQQRQARGGKARRAGADEPSQS